MLPLFGNVRAWMMTAEDIVNERPAPPPSTGSDQMARELAEVRRYVDSGNREELAIANGPGFRGRIRHKPITFPPRTVPTSRTIVALRQAASRPRVAMAYDDDAESHERLIARRFALQRKLDALPEERAAERALLRDVIRDLDDAITRIRHRHQT
jgi:hypothetical protein